jgi:hypothetical protein
MSRRAGTQASKNKNAGLVGPALSLSFHLWGTTGFVYPPADSFGSLFFVTAIEEFHKPHITNARFSNSFCKTGSAQPAISTRVIASLAAWGDTP